MYQAHIISVNPGIKTLGEMHNPTGMRRLSSVAMVRATAKVERNNGGTLLFTQRDMTRPAFVLLLMRMVMAAVCGWIIMMSVNTVVFWLLGITAVLILAGFMTRIAVVSAVVGSVYALFGVVDTALMPYVMTGIALVVPLAGLLFVTGAGRWSLDRLTFRRQIIKV